MSRQQTSRGALLTSNLPQLQNLIKRDPAAYREEFMQQFTHYQSIRNIFEINPDEEAQHFRELVTFIAQVAQCYPKETADFPKEIASILLERYSTLNPDTRKSIVQNLVMLRNKDVITSIELLKSLFPLLPRTTSPTLRTFIRTTILNDIRTANMRTKNHKLNRAVQAMLFGMVERGMDSEVLGDKGKLRSSNFSGGGKPNPNTEAAMWAIVLTKELWKKQVWSDHKSVSIVSLGCFHPVTKVQSAAIHFFLGSEDEKNESDEEQDDIPNLKSLQHQRTINKKTRSGEKKMAKIVKVVNKKRAEKRNAEPTPNFPALQLLSDPQTFAEKLFDGLNKYDKRYSLEHKILIMQLLSRVMGAHQLCVLPFYSYTIKYLTYHQLRITAILVSLAQSVHSLTPPDVLTPILRKLAAEFIHPGVGSEVIAAGINSIREVCRRQPLCMEEDLLGDLVEYRKSKDKGVVTAARGLLQLYREVNPGLLKKRERGKEATMGIAKGMEPLAFGHAPDVAVTIEGLDLLEDYLHAERKEPGDDDEEADPSESGAGWDGWEVESDSESDDSGGWIDMDSDGDDVMLSDSDSPEEQEKERAAKGSAQEPETEETRTSTLATTKILTPADFALLNELRIQAATKSLESGTTSGPSAKRKLAAMKASHQSALTSNSAIQDSFLSETEILGPRKKAKADYAERMASIQKGREGREKFGSFKGKKMKENPSSSTNREKARNKPIMMIMASSAVKGKKRASLKEKQKRLRAHIDKAKKTHH